MTAKGMLNNLANDLRSECVQPERGEGLPLTVLCTFCGSKPFYACINRETQNPMPFFHVARVNDSKKTAWQNAAESLPAEPQNAQMKHWKYLNYVIRHKWFVFQAGLKTRASVWRLIKHDWSKFLPSEWVPYAEYFYGNKPKLQREENDSFNHAWLLHQRRNDHHWQYWVLRNDDGTTQALPMPDAARKEMLADWMGAGRAITGRWETAEWYSRNREKIILHPDTRDFIEAKLAVQVDLAHQSRKRG